MSNHGSFDYDPKTGKLTEHLREHAFRVAGAGPSEEGGRYDPETFGLEVDAADEIERLRAELKKLRELSREVVTATWTVRDQALAAKVIRLREVLGD